MCIKLLHSYFCSGSGFKTTPFFASKDWWAKGLDMTMVGFSWKVYREKKRQEKKKKMVPDGDGRWNLASTDRGAAIILVGRKVVVGTGGGVCNCSESSTSRLLLRVPASDVDVCSLLWCPSVDEKYKSFSECSEWTGSGSSPPDCPAKARKSHTRKPHYFF